MHMVLVWDAQAHLPEFYFSALGLITLRNLRSASRGELVLHFASTSTTRHAYFQWLLQPDGIISLLTFVFSYLETRAVQTHLKRLGF